MRPNFALCCEALSLAVHPGDFSWPSAMVQDVNEAIACSAGLFSVSPSGGPLLYSDVKFVYNSQQLNGTQRVLLDNVISEEQCRELHRVASVSRQCPWGGERDCHLG